MSNKFDIENFFDDLYRRHVRYWWHQDVRYSPDADSYPFSLLTQLTLRSVAGRGPGRALDLGAGEGTDSIRLALLGYTVTAVEISRVGADKISKFAAEAGVTVNVERANICTYEPDGEFDIIICNGVLHYIDEKRPVVRRMQMATRRGGINVVSLWSKHTPVPECHTCVPVFCDDENGVVAESYQEWPKELFYYEREKPEASHTGMPPHAHSHIKLIARKP
jgi:2-polyprenyl-3-methyl-5-hydroxy-6-metoxy-1,4-benzoquinol methylase